jgi:hypothetical protein
MADILESIRATLKSVRLFFITKAARVCNPSPSVKGAVNRSAPPSSGTVFIASKLSTIEFFGVVLQILIHLLEVIPFGLKDF